MDADEAYILTVVVERYDLLAVAVLIERPAGIMEGGTEMVAAGDDTLQQKMTFSLWVEFHDVDTLGLDVYLPGYAEYHLTEILTLHAGGDVHQRSFEEWTEEVAVEAFVKMIQGVIDAEQ